MTPLTPSAWPRLRTELDRWMKDQGDPGIPMDTFKTYHAARAGKHLYKAR